MGDLQEEIKKWAEENDMSASANGNDPVANAEANPNGEIKPILNNAGQPIKTPAIQNVELVPVLNSMGKQIGTKPKVTYAPQAGFNSPAPPITLPVTTITGADQRPVFTHVAPAAPPAAAAPVAAPVHTGPAAPFVTGYEHQLAAAQDAGNPLINGTIGLDLAAKDRQGAAAAMAQESQDYAGKIAANEEDRKTKLDPLEANIHNLTNDEAARDYTKEFFAQKSTGQKVAGFIAAAFGGFLQGWNHLSSNPAIDQMNHQVDEYVANAKAGSVMRVSAAKGLYDHYYQQTKDHEAADALTHAAIWQGLGERLQDAAKNTDDVKERLRLTEAEQAAKMEVAKYQDAIARSKQAASAGGAATMTPAQLVALQKGMLENKLLEQKLNGGSAPAAAPAAAVANGDDLGPLDSIAAPHAGDEGWKGAGARMVLGDKLATAGNINNLIVADMNANKGGRVNPESIKAWGLSHGAYDDPKAYAARVAKQKNPIIAGAEAPDAPETFEKQ